MADTEAGPSGSAPMLPHRQEHDHRRRTYSPRDWKGDCERTNSHWCLTGAVVTFLCAVSLIGLSEGWLEAMGLGRRMVHDKDCSSPEFSKQTLKLLAEEPLQRLAVGLGTKKSEDQDFLGRFEGSGLVLSRDSSNYYVVFDNSFFLGKFASELTFHSTPGYNRSTNKILPWPDKSPDDVSGFEAITFNSSSGTYLVVQEAIRYRHSIFANVIEVDIDPTTDEVTQLGSCIADYHFAADNKGFEGAGVLQHDNGKSYLLGLCEGNFCQGGSQGRRAGHGRIVVMERQRDEGGNCTYSTVSVVPIPRDANFEDYSDLSLRGKHVAIVSQASSAVWVGRFELVPEALGVMVLHPGRVWDFPRNDLCQVKYCNVEGISWEAEDVIAAVSDRMKGKGRQHYRCWDKEQSLHAFAVNDKSLMRGGEL
uniref:Uncharacterized protein n=1 Tax=Tetraselmis sp. GSL018 TaxID=582737 RepID=A0A061S1A4_9CHLO|mmetsp:Transcript_23808/g.56738  ORF Transcript_23808/g.56738 Transcript_23808/m.56738 type:complete len:421 (-) Transcript_23808:25-1287(-)|eukprot:CAMPEP_0177610502 /NCGR_PEP_ID=MMETSP0419_2-20121207/19819_1 /TAXON_ID=582737 /ORGANISM="Tetraselmis sp., Strain GSL018" /LENGTH=420 /DNA_ID=CAMNT_0019105823 /DNA_START=283 /DNA_END=1545 /DNA_ORIENTATION=-